MNFKRIFAVMMIALVSLSLMIFAGCTNPNPPQSGNYVSDNQEVTTNDVTPETTVSQPQVNTESFPSNYTQIQTKVYKSALTKKRTTDGVTTGSDMMEILKENDCQITDKVKKAVKKEIKACVNEQVKEVTCTDADISISDSDSSLAYITITFTYNKTGAEDINILTLSLGNNK